MPHHNGHRTLCNHQCWARVVNVWVCAALWSITPVYTFLLTIAHLCICFCSFFQMLGLLIVNDLQTSPPPLQKVRMVRFFKHTFQTKLGRKKNCKEKLSFGKNVRKFFEHFFCRKFFFLSKLQNIGSFPIKDMQTLIGSNPLSFGPVFYGWWDMC